MREDKKKRQNPYALSKRPKKKKPANFNPYDLSRTPRPR